MHPLAKIHTIETSDSRCGPYIRHARLSRDAALHKDARWPLLRR